MKHARFYKAWVHHCDDGCLLSWHRKKGDAQQWVKDMMKDPDYDGPEGVSPVVIHLSTDALLRWLNMHFQSDNG